ncbi:hypothetical protein AO386_03145 [Pseudomonas syringae ICMP 11292]|nr:hypothetical protein AO386_03145 [Pseudomonas syringae ICMP 11292]
MVNTVGHQDWSLARAWLNAVLQSILRALTFASEWVDTSVDTSDGRAYPGGLIKHEHQSATDFLGTAPEWLKCNSVLIFKRCSTLFRFVYAALSAGCQSHASIR